MVCSKRVIAHHAGFRIVAISLLISVCLFGRAFAAGQDATKSGLVDVQSKHGMADTVRRFEDAVRGKGWMVFGEIDHAAAAEKAGLHLSPRTVVVFGDPRTGTARMQSNPTLAIDLPMRALVWQDDAGKVWLTYNSADFLSDTIYRRHGLVIASGALEGLAQFLEQTSHIATD